MQATKTNSRVKGRRLCGLGSDANALKILKEYKMDE